MRHHYDRRQLAEAFRQVGLIEGDLVFCHSNVGLFGLPAEGGAADQVFEVVLGAFQDVIGPAGTLVVPTFSYSFCKGLAYDPDTTPSDCGFFTEFFRQHPGALRSLDPIFSVAAIGPAAERLIRDLPRDCFGADSFWGRFWRAEGVFCNLNYDATSTFFHFVERQLNVPYRYDKVFAGESGRGGQRRAAEAVFFCRDAMNPGTAVAIKPFDALARSRGLVRSARVGRGRLDLIPAADMYRLIEEALGNQPWLLTVSWDQPDPPSLEAPPDRPCPLPPATDDPFGIVQALWPLARDTVSDGHGAALQWLSQGHPLTRLSFPTGTRVGAAIVPERWTCVRARVEAADGVGLLDAAACPLHVASYSAGFTGVVSREHLLEHVLTDPERPDAVPYRSLYPWRQWGLAASRDWAESLPPGDYRVQIETITRYGSLDVGVVTVPGNGPERLLLVTHLGHSGSANTGLSGVAVAARVMRHLADEPPPVTVTWLIVPESLGVAGFHAAEPSSAPVLGALCLDALGHDAVLTVVADGGEGSAFARAWADLAPGGVVPGLAERFPVAGQLTAAAPDLPVVALTRGATLFSGARTSWDVPDRLQTRSLDEAVSVLLAGIRRFPDHAVRR